MVLAEVGQCMARSRFLPDPAPETERRPSVPTMEAGGDQPTPTREPIRRNPGRHPHTLVSRNDSNREPVVTGGRFSARHLGAGLLLVAMVALVAVQLRFGGSPTPPVDDHPAAFTALTGSDSLETPVSPGLASSGQFVATPSSFRVEIVTPPPASTPLTRPTLAPLRPANELGRIPILMYHAFVPDPGNTDQWTITYDQFREQLDVLRVNDFVMVGLGSVIQRELDLPAGKSSVILTFDDSNPSQFRLRGSAGGGFEVDPDTAVGVLEAYGEEYPYFVGPAFFAVLPYSCFASEGDPSTCEQRLLWLTGHGYEVGNHTNNHEDLTEVADERFKSEIAEARHWINDRIDGPNNLSNVLVLPYGQYPVAAHQKAWLFDGFWYHSELYRLALVVEVSGGPVSSPYSILWTKNLMRYNSNPASFDYWADQFSTGATPIYISDGDPTALTVPPGWEDSVNIRLLVDDGLKLNVDD